MEKWQCMCVTWENARYPKEVAGDGTEVINPFSVMRECESL